MSTNTLGKRLSKVKDTISRKSQGNLIYKLSCKDCDAVYIGETSKPVDIRVKEHVHLVKKHPRDMEERQQLKQGIILV